MEKTSLSQRRNGLQKQENQIHFFSKPVNVGFGTNIFKEDKKARDKTRTQKTKHAEKKRKKRKNTDQA